MHDKIKYRPWGNFVLPVAMKGKSKAWEIYFACIQQLVFLWSAEKVTLEQVIWLR